LNFREFSANLILSVVGSRDTDEIRGLLWKSPQISALSFWDPQDKFCLIAYSRIRNSESTDFLEMYVYVPVLQFESANFKPERILTPVVCAFATLSWEVLVKGCLVPIPIEFPGDLRMGTNTMVLHFLEISKALKGLSNCLLWKVSRCQKFQKDVLFQFLVQIFYQFMDLFRTDSDTNIVGHYIDFWLAEKSSIKRMYCSNFQEFSTTDFLRTDSNTIGFPWNLEKASNFSSNCLLGPECNYCQKDVLFQFPNPNLRENK